jgi:hypothetical protein
MSIQYIDELEEWMENNHIKKEDICLVGSAALAYDGIRDNHDLEIAVRPGVCRDRILKCLRPKEERKLSKNVHFFKNQFFNIGITDQEIFEKKLYRLSKEGYKVILLEIEYLYKLSLNRDKDWQDARLIKSFSPDIDEKSRKYRHKAIFHKFIYRIFQVCLLIQKKIEKRGRPV